MIRTKDSIEDLRKSRKRSLPTGSSTSSTPLDELKQLAKKRREDAQATVPDTPQRPTKVQFALEKNTTRSRSYDDDDLNNAWNSRTEAAFIKLGAQVTVETFKQGKLDNNTDCIRGLEAHVDLVRTDAKIARCHNFTVRVLEQQHFLTSIMGRANDQILAKMSKVLSAEDVREARENGTRDANAALYIHACDQATRFESVKSTDKMTEDLARCMKSDELVSLLKRQMVNSV